MKTAVGYMMVLLDYVEAGDKYLLSIKDLKKKAFVCIKQEMPHDFVLFGVPVEDLEDPADVCRFLKTRISDLIRTGASRIK